MPKGARFNEDLLNDSLKVIKGLHHVTIGDNAGGYSTLDDRYQEWFREHELIPIEIIELVEIPEQHTGKVYYWLFGPLDADSDFFFEDANVAILFKLTFGGM